MRRGRHETCMTRKPVRAGVLLTRFNVVCLTLGLFLVRVENSTAREFEGP